MKIMIFWQIEQCKYEQGLISARETESDSISTSQCGEKPDINNTSKHEEMLNFDEVVVTRCGMVHLAHPVETLLHSNAHDQTPQANTEVLASV